jgi:hypothetical protein
MEIAFWILVGALGTVAAVFILYCATPLRDDQRR